MPAPNVVHVPFPAFDMSDLPVVMGGYWHLPYADPPPANTAPSRLSDSDIQNFYARTNSHAPSIMDVFMNLTSNMENKLARFVHQYRHAMIAQAELFPEACQQKVIFHLMLAAADGLIRVDGGAMRTLLHYMAMNGVSDMLQHLVDAGFNVNDCDSDYRTPLH